MAIFPCAQGYKGHVQENVFNSDMAVLFKGKDVFPVFVLPTT